jgi:esterase/lipase
MFKAIFNGLHLSISMPRPIKKEELERFTSPCMIACAENDVMCPSGKVFEFASERLSNFEKKVLFENKPHMVTSYTDSMELFIHATGDFLADK